MLIGNETRQHYLKDAAIYVLTMSVIDVVDRVRLLTKMLQILFSNVMKVFGGREEGPRNTIYTEGTVRI
jgi:hypothetical protein